MLRWVQIFGVEQGSTNSRPPPNFVWIQLLLPGPIGAPSCSLLVEIPPHPLWDTPTKSLITSPVFVQMACRENGTSIHVQSIQNHLDYYFPTPVGDGGGSQSI